LKEHQGQSLTGASFTSVEQLKEHIDAFIERSDVPSRPPGRIDATWTRRDTPPTKAMEWMR
jgi:hypothetical protein